MDTGQLQPIGTRPRHYDYLQTGHPTSQQRKTETLAHECVCIENQTQEQRGGTTSSYHNRLSYLSQTVPLDQTGQANIGEDVLSCAINSHFPPCDALFPLLLLINLAQNKHFYCYSQVRRKLSVLTGLN